jgi:hypothetical protein
MKKDTTNARGLKTELESSITRKILNYLKSVPGCFAWKAHGGMYGYTGIPDIICCYHGRFFGFEVKRPGNKPTAIQEKAIRDIAGAGGTAIVVYSVEDVKQYIK